MDFKFENQIGDVSIITHSAEALSKMVQKFGIHIIVHYPDGYTDSESEWIHDVDELLTEYPNISREDAEAYFAGKKIIEDVEVDDEEYTVNIDYPIPEIGYEDDLLE